MAMRLTEDSFKLESIFKDYCVEMDYTPDLLKHLLCCSEETDINGLTVCKEKIVSDDIKPNVPRQVCKPKKLEKEDLDLTGSPLKCSFELHEELDDDEDNSDFSYLTTQKKHNVFYTPISPIEARKLLGQFNLRNVSGSTPYVWCLTSGNEPTIILGSQKKGDNITTFEVQFTKAKMIGNLENLDSLLSKHNSLQNSPVKVDSFATSEYNVMDEHYDFSEMKLIFHWSKPKIIMESPSVDAFAKLEISMRPGDEKLASYDNWAQLQLLKGFVAGTKNEGVLWRKRLNDEPTMKEGLSRFFEKVKSLTPRSYREKSDVFAYVATEDNMEEKIGVITDNVRQDVDFLDCLWSVLYKVESYQELSNSLTTVFKTLQQEEIRPFIYTRNETQLARIVQKIFQGTDEPILEMTGKTPLNILVEIGLEKLKRDYIHTLITSDLTSQDDIRPLIPKSEDKMQELENILKLHYILELIVLVQTFLSPNYENLRSIVNQALQHLNKSRCISWEKQKFAINLQSSHYKNKLSKMKPYAWQCSLKSEESVSTVCRFTIEPPMQYISPNENLMRDFNGTDFSYFTSILTSVTRTM